MTALQTLTLEAALQQAVAHHQAGRLPEAEQLYRAILQAAPNQPDANHNLGVLAGQVGQHAAGLPYLKTALEANPAQGQYVLSYVEVLLATGQAEEALDVLYVALQRGFNTPAVQALWRKAETAAQHPTSMGNTPSSEEMNRLAALFNAGRYEEIDKRAHLLIGRYPDCGLAWKALGASLQMQEKDALVALQKAVELLPDDAAAHYNLGNTLSDLGHNEEAAASFRRALEIQPDFLEAFFNLGNTLLALGQFDEAISIYLKTLEIRPDDAKIHNSLGNALNNLAQFDQAVASFRRALEIKPDYAEAHNNLGVALQDFGQLNRALASFRRALEIKPDYAEAHNNLGRTLKDIGLLDGAVASYAKALAINQDYAEAHNNLGVALQALGQLEGALASYRRALEIKPDCANTLSNLLFAHNLLVDRSPADMLVVAHRFGELAARRSTPHTTWRNAPDPDRSLRIGFVSGDLCNHPVGYFLESLLTAQASNTSGQLEFFAYPSCFRTDALTKRIKACCHGWHSAEGLSDERLARLICDDSIDILIDLSGHTAHNRLSMFAWKPAPIQVSWLGYFATTGVAAMDYFLADPWTLLKTEEAYFTEKIQRLPETRLCFTPPDADVPVAPLPALTNGHITFGCFNNLTKMNDVVVALWARVLKAVPGSRLFLKTKQLGEATVRQSTHKRFAAHGISADRLILEGASPRAEYLAAYRKVDIALDPFPYPGGATSAEGLWMGVPLLTLTGERFLSRQGVGLLMNAGLPEWIAVDADDYVAKAAMNASDLQRLATLRDGLRQQVLASPIFDAPRFARHFEAALRDMWRKWCASRT